MDRFMLAHNPLKNEEFEQLYILHTCPPRMLISVRPLSKGNRVEDELDFTSEKVYHSNLGTGDFASSILKVEIDLGSGTKFNNLPLTPELEGVLDRAWRWFVAFKIKCSREQNAYGLPGWVFM